MKEMHPIMGNSPQQVKCPYCSNTTVSTVTYKNGYISYITCLLVLLLLGLLMSFLLIPLVMLVTKTLVHRCSVCQEEIGGDGKVFHVLGIKDSVVSFKIGELGLIVTKTIVIGITMFILTLAVLAYRIKNIEYSQWQGMHHHDHPVVEINDTWIQFLETCNRERLYSNFTAQRNCGDQYLGKTIQWKGIQNIELGFAIRVEDYQQSLLKFLHHAVSILVRMDPAESEFHPDLLLTADSEIAANLTSTIETLSRGSEFSFTAVISSIGDAQNIRHLHLTNCTKEDGYIEIAPHLHSHSRYGDEPHFLNG